MLKRSMVIAATTLCCLSIAYGVYPYKTSAQATGDEVFRACFSKARLAYRLYLEKFEGAQMAQAIDVALKAGSSQSTAHEVALYVYQLPVYANEEKESSMRGVFEDVYLDCLSAPAHTGMSLPHSDYSLSPRP